jgi:hypothetical protein
MLDLSSARLALGLELSLPPSRSRSSLFTRRRPRAKQTTKTRPAHAGLRGAAREKTSVRLLSDAFTWASNGAWGFFSTLSCFGSDALALVVFGSSCFSYDDLATWLSSQRKTPRIGSPM